MDINQVMGPAVVAAGVSGIITVIGMWINRSTVVALHKEKIEADKLLARQKFDYDKQQALFKRRFELAEQILSDAYTLRALMVYVRNGAAFGGEGTSREPAADESDNLKRRRDVYYVPAERLHKEKDFLGAMFTRRYASRALFGEDAEKAYNLMLGAVHRVRVASAYLIDWTREFSSISSETIQKLEADIWSGMATVQGKDQIAEDIEEAVKLLEAICSPVLSWVE